MASEMVDTDAASIAANRAGQITARQWARLQPIPESRLGMIFGWVIAGVVLVPLMIFLLWMAWHAFQSYPGEGVGILVGAWLAVLAIMTGVGLTAFFNPVSRQRRLLRELRAGYVAQEEGQVVFERSGYVARANGRVLCNSTGGTEVNLPPGWYRFYFLPGSGRLLSAEALSPLAAGQMQGEVLDALARALRFDLNDLAQNRAGQLSARQRLRLARGAIGLVVVWAGLLALLIALVANIAQGPLPLLWEVLLGAGILVAMFAIARRTSDVLAGQVTLVEGVIVVMRLSVRIAQPIIMCWRAGALRFPRRRMGRWWRVCAIGCITLRPARKS